MDSKQPLSQTFPSIWRILHYFSPHVKKQRGLIMASTVALLIETVLRALEPIPLKIIFDRVFAKHFRHSIKIPGLEWMNHTDPMKVLLYASVAMIVITALRALADYFNTIGFSLVGNRVLTDVRGQVYRHLQALSLSFHAKERSGDLTVRVIADVNILKDIVVSAALPLVGSQLMLLGMLIVMFRLNHQLALIAAATFPIFWLATRRLIVKVREVSRSQRKRQGTMAGTAAESMSAIKIVQALSLESTFTEAFLAENRKILNDDVKATRLAAGLGRTVEILIAAFTSLILWYGARLVLGGSLTPGDLIVFITYLKRAFSPVQDYAKYTARLARAAAAGERVVDVLQRTPDVYDKPDAIAAPPFRGDVRFEHVTFEYEPGLSVLQDVHFSVRAGQHVALVGDSGIGKSTLVSLILRLYDPVEGRVLIDDRDIRDYTIESLRAQISIVLQDSILFATSIRENIGYGAPNCSAEEIVAAAKLANAHNFIEALPQGYDTVIGERGVTLSAGQRQRIAIARAAVRKAAILIFDEPTTGLDKENEKVVVEALNRLAQDRTVFLITHDLLHASRADLIFYIDGGRVRESGSHEELMHVKGKYAALYLMHETAASWQTGERV